MRKTVVQSARISKITAVFAIFLISFLLFPLFTSTNPKSLYADADTHHPGFTFTVADGEATIVSPYTGPNDVKIPDTVQVNGTGTEYPVTSIGQFAFENCPDLTSISIPSGVTSIGDVAFAGCKKLDDVEFTAPSTVQTIGDQAFQTCILLTSISIPSSVTSIGDYAFSGCYLLAIVTFEDESAPTFGTDSFLNIKSGAIANVPAGSINTVGGYYNNRNATSDYPFYNNNPLELKESPAEDQAAPTGLAGVAPTAALTDGKITGTTTLMEYQLQGAGSYTK